LSKLKLQRIGDPSNTLVVTDPSAIARWKRLLAKDICQWEIKKRNEALRNAVPEDTEGAEVKSTE